MDGPAPVVFANHGAGQTAFVFMEATDIKEAADKYGFIAVTFDVTSNADYMADLYEMVKADCERWALPWTSPAYMLTASPQAAVL